MSFAKCTIYLTNIYVVRKEESLPTWERGLKLALDNIDSAFRSRSPRGSVD